MVKVPEYQGYVELRPSYRQGIDINATPEAFGAGIGRGMAALGEGMGQAAQAFAQVKQLEDVTRAKEADNNYAGWLRERMYGENGFMTTEGRNAVDGRRAFEEEAEKKRREFGAGLTPGAQRSYQNASTARIQSAFQSSIVHTANARKQWFNDASVARVQSFADDALENYQNPALVQKNVAAGVLELRERGRMAGWDGDTLKAREEEYISGVHKNVALRIAQTDPDAARKYAKANSKSISGKDMTDLDGVFAPLVIDEQAKRKAGEFLDSSARNRTNRFAATDLPQEAYGLLGVIGGTEAPGYNVINGGGRFDSFSDHPRQRGAGGTSTAAGKYQFVMRTWDRVAGANGFRDFSPENQDRGAWWLAQQDYKTNTGRDLMTDLRAGNYSSIRRGLASTWEGIAKLSDAQFAARMSRASGVSPSFADPTAFLDGISNPALRQATSQRISVIMALQEKQRKADMDALKTQAFGVIDAGNSPDQIPAMVRAQLGREEMSGLWSYYEARAKGNVVTDDRTLYDLQTMFAQDPRSFADIDLFKYRDRLSNSDWEKVNGWRQTALTDERKAKDQGVQITSAMSQAQTQLEAVGITTTNKKGTEREKEAARLAQFQMALTSQMEEFARANNKQPTQSDIQAMINRLLLPIVVRDKPQAEYGLFPNPITSFNNLFSGGQRNAFAFEAQKRPDGSSVDVVVKYADIPIDLRRGIAIDLERELGRKPSNEEVVDRYEQFILNQ